jgi:hypothetical protein
VIQKKQGGRRIKIKKTKKREERERKKAKHNKESFTNMDLFKRERESRIKRGFGVGIKRGFGIRAWLWNKGLALGFLTRRGDLIKNHGVFNFKATGVGQSLLDAWHPPQTRAGQSVSDRF